MIILKVHRLSKSKKNIIWKWYEWNCVNILDIFQQLFRMKETCEFIFSHQFATHSNSLFNHRWQLLHRRQRPVFVCKLCDKLFPSMTISWCKTLIKTFIFFAKHHCLLLFTYRWRVSDVNIAGTVKQLFVPVSETRSSATAEKQRVSCPHGGG